MNVKISIGIFLPFLAILAIGLTGCGATGAKFQGFTKPQANKALVYIYRPAAFSAAGVNYTAYDVTNKKVIGAVRNGGYIKYNVKPGKITIAMMFNPDAGLTALTVATSLATGITYVADGNGRLDGTYTLNLKRGETKCIKWDPGKITWNARKIKRRPVSNKQCKKEIINTQYSY